MFKSNNCPGDGSLVSGMVISMTSSLPSGVMALRQFCRIRSASASFQSTKMNLSTIGPHLEAPLQRNPLQRLCTALDSSWPQSPDGQLPPPEAGRILCRAHADWAPRLPTEGRHLLRRRRRCVERAKNRNVAQCRWLLELKRYPSLD